MTARGEETSGAADPQCVLYDRFVTRGEAPDEFSAKRLYPGLPGAEAVARIERLAAARGGDSDLSREREARGEVHTALAEADVPRSDGVDEPLYSEAYRVRLLRQRAERAEAQTEALAKRVDRIAAEHDGVSPDAYEAITDATREALASLPPPQEEEQ